MHFPNDQAIVNTLRKHSASVTQNRITVLKLLSQSRTGLSMSGILKLSTDVLDRVSVYRAIQLFLKKGLVRIIPVSQGNPRYILSDFLKISSSDSGNQQPVYFICNDCGHTELVEQPSVISIKKTGNHHVKSCYIILEGLCNNCIQ